MSIMFSIYIIEYRENNLKLNKSELLGRGLESLLSNVKITLDIFL